VVTMDGHPPPHVRMLEAADGWLEFSCGKLYHHGRTACTTVSRHGCPFSALSCFFSVFVSSLGNVNQPSTSMCRWRCSMGLHCFTEKRLDKLRAFQGYPESSRDHL
jgi:hypothetical protein